VKRTKRILLVVLLGFLLVMGAACSGTPETPEEPTEPEESTTEPETDTDDKYGGTFVRDAPYGGGPDSLDPIKSNRIASILHTMNMFDGLVKFSPEGSDVIPAVAESWDISDDGCTYTFHLRDNAFFHNGRNIVAEDFVYSFERLADPANASPMTYYLDGVVGKQEFANGEADHISGLKAVDDHTFEVTLTAPDSTFLTTLAWQALSVVPREVVEERGADFGNRPVGSGAFAFVEWIKDDHVTMEAFEDYYDGRPYLDRVILRSIPENSTIEAEYLAGNLDAFIATTSIYRKYKDDPQYKDLMLTVAEYFTRNIGFNTTKKPFDDKRVRQAFNYAVDGEAILTHVLDGKGFLATGWLPSSNWAYDPNLEGYGYDPEKALALMEEAGYADGVEVPIVTTEHAEWGLPIVEAVMPYVDEIGMTLVPEVMTGGVMNERIIQGDYTAYIWSNGGDAHPVAYMYRWHSTRQEITNRYSNPEVDQLLERAKQSADKDEVTSLVREIDRIVLDDAPVWPFHYNMAVTMFQPWVHGMKKFPVDMAMQDLSTVWLDPDHRD